MEANVRKHYLRGKLGYTADNLYLQAKQPTRISFFLSHATAYKEDYNYVHVIGLPLNIYIYYFIYIYKYISCGGVLKPLNHRLGACRVVAPARFAAVV